jgi:eukaryotic-like serine/threonine-protein kinase
LFTFLTRRHFLINLAVMALLCVGLVWGTLQLLGKLTKHDQFLTVPNVFNKPTKESIALLESKGFKVFIQDSVYTDTMRTGIVLKQFPEANSIVKINRTILLTVNKYVPPMVSVPNMVSKSKDYAIELLYRAHLKLGDTTFRPSFMFGAVIEYSLNGKILAATDKVPWGSKIDLVVGSGLSDVPFAVPALQGLTLAEAKKIMDENYLMLASVIADKGVKDSNSAFIYRQNPPRFNEDGSVNYMRQGQVVDLWISAEQKILDDSTNSTLDARPTQTEEEIQAAMEAEKERQEELEKQREAKRKQEEKEKKKEKKEKKEDGL